MLSERETGPVMLMPPGNYPRDYIVEEFLEIPSYGIDIDRMKIHDVVWGDTTIRRRAEEEERAHREQLRAQGKELPEGISDDYDALLLELAQTELFQRLQAVEQLTFSGEFSTTPNTSHFSRWQHIWGSLTFVRKMTEDDPRFSERDRIVLQLRTLFSDVGQTSFSHLGDWIFQGLQGGEDLHDMDLRALLRTNDIETILTRYGLTIEETVFPETEDWVECPTPDICVDRLDYGLREILRWGAPSIPIMLYKSALQDPKSLFEIDDQNKLVMKDPLFARLFAAGYSILPSEHWSHPTHRVQMEIMQSVVKEALLYYAEGSDYTAHVRDLMYGIDSDFSTFFAMWEGAEFAELMKSIAYAQRRIFAAGRRHDLNLIFSGILEEDWAFPDFPDPLTPYSFVTEKFGEYPLPLQLSVEEIEGDIEQHIEACDAGLVMYLPALKARKVDPLVEIDNGSVRLSDLEPSYSDFFVGQKRFMQRNYRAIIHMRRDIAEKIVSRHEQTNAAWVEVVKRERSEETLKQIIAGTAFTLMGNPSLRFDNFHFSARFRYELEKRVIDAMDL